MVLPGDPQTNRGCDDGYGFVSPVGAFPANPFGLHDMIGNVWEWTEDCFIGNYDHAPTVASMAVTGGDCQHRSIRGGSWHNYPNVLRAANRFSLPVEMRSTSLGFRLARLPDAAALDVQKLLAPTDKVILHAKDVSQVEVFEWERNGKRSNAWPGDGQTPPYDAADLKLRAFSFPGGMVRELYYPKGAHTPPHENFENIIMYGLTGKRAQIVDEDVGVLGQGDASYHPVGVSHHSESVVAGSQLEFAFPATKGPEPKGVWLSATDVPEVAVAAWVRDGKQDVAVGDKASAAPADAAHYTAKFFTFPGALLIEMHVPKGTKSQPHADAVDRLVYVVKGRLHVVIGTVADDVGPGDVLRDPAGTMHHFEALEDTVLVTAAAPQPANH